jgi:hypothetical protein
LTAAANHLAAVYDLRGSMRFTRLEAPAGGVMVAGSDANCTSTIEVLATYVSKNRPHNVPPTESSRESLWLVMFNEIGETGRVKWRNSPPVSGRILPRIA